jgi:7-cyano-7-deazaguanine synthase in queuosine biosynthesis
MKENRRPACFVYYLDEGYANTCKSEKDATKLSLSEFRNFDRQIWDAVTRKLHLNPTALAIDLLDVARALFLADCRSKRPSSWKRVIKVTIPVRKIGSWSKPDVADSLHKLLAFATGDVWDVRFILHSFPYSPVPSILFPEPIPTYNICLFSEGSDSLCGLANRLYELSEIQFLTVSALTQHQSDARITETIKELNALNDNRIQPIDIPFFRGNYRSRKNEESTQRTRSFLLLALGTIAAILTNQQSIEIYENGLEAFNFPLEPYKHPERLSRAMHPILLGYMSEFVSHLTNNPFQINAPFLFFTKSDLMRTAFGKLPTQMITDTISCLHFPQRRPGGNQCGICSGCLLRRISLASAGIEDPFKGNYQFDIYTGFQGERSIDNTDALWGPIYQAHLKWHWLKMALSADNPLRDLFQYSGQAWRRNELIEYASKVGSEKLADVPDGILRLYRKYEWEWRVAQENIPLLRKLEEPETVDSDEVSFI